MNDELRNYALDQMHHRLRQVRAYSLLDEDGSQITVHAALVKSDPPTVSDPAQSKNPKHSRRCCGRYGTLFSWLDAQDGKPHFADPRAGRSLAESLSAFETNMYDFLDKLSGEIDVAVITTFEQVDHAAWPS